jgi:alpha-L-fucosidase
MLVACFCACVGCKVWAPPPWGQTPSPQQLRYHREELAAFIHFGVDTFTGREWGTGHEDPELFNPKALNTSQWVAVLKNAGFKRVIYIAKHHDGMCYWKTNYTRHQVNESRSFQERSKELHQSGDVVEELSRACSEQDLNMGLYLSPWDMNSSYYGDDTKYNEYYMSQLKELLGNPKYGNKGRWAEVWMDGAKGKGYKDQTYWFLKWFDLILSLQPDAVIFSDYGSSCRWIGNENGYAGDPCWSKLNGTLQRWAYDHHTSGVDLNHGDPIGDIWSVGECDVTITSGWYWTTGRLPKTMEDLTKIYLASVGRGEPLLLNVPPTTEGTMPEDFVHRVTEFGDTIKQTYAIDFTEASEASAKASSVWGDDPQYGASNVLSPDPNKYWAMKDESTGWLEIDLGRERVFDWITISEHLPLGQRIIHVTCEVYSRGSWRFFGRSNTIGAKRILRSHRIVGSQIRIIFERGDFYAPPCIEKVGVFRSSGFFSVSDNFPDGLSFAGYPSINEKGWIEKEDCWYANGTGGTLDVKLDCSEFLIVGSVDPSFGSMGVYVNGQLIGNASGHSLNHHQRIVLFKTSGLSAGSHSIEIRQLGSLPLAIHGIYYLPSNAPGMFEFEEQEYSVVMGNKITINVKRLGSSHASVSVLVQAWPQTAVAGTNYKDIQNVLTFKAGEVVQSVVIETFHSAQPVDLRFRCTLWNATGGSIEGFNQSATITIKLK